MMCRREADELIRMEISENIKPKAKTYIINCQLNMIKNGRLVTCDSLHTILHPMIKCARKGLSKNVKL